MTRTRFPALSVTRTFPPCMTAMPSGDWRLVAFAGSRGVSRTAPPAGRLYSRTDPLGSETNTLPSGSASTCDENSVVDSGAGQCVMDRPDGVISLTCWLLLSRTYKLPLGATLTSEG